MSARTWPEPGRHVAQGKQGKQTAAMEVHSWRIWHKLQSTVTPAQVTVIRAENEEEEEEKNSL